MRLLGESQGMPSAVLADLAEAARQRRPFVVVADGDDVTAVVADPQDTAAEVVTAARRFIQVLS